MSPFFHLFQLIIHITTNISNRYFSFFTNFLNIFNALFLRSSVKAGTAIRITSPSLVGLTPKLAAIIAFSMSATEVLSYGEITSKRASGTLMLANCCTGVGAP